ncbi:ECF RNA polymerase sigma factor SigK [Nakamurella lactea]|uniref:ECF RNA polymerase sigma factor SigK n=1 Tax=Nakamurella lactea TaxID=459515 RepID=UPI00041F5A94|nr:ECF RNA polymerase sigma factor SigK [Nakamurella lactea]
MVGRSLSAVPDDPGRGPGDAPGSEDDAAELLRRIAQGHTEAFESFYRQFGARVFGLCRRVVRDPGLAEEVAQEVFLEIWRRAGYFDRSKGSAAGWVMSVTHSRAVDRVRSTQASADREAKVAASTASRESDTVVEAVEHRWERRAVRRCLLTLTDIQRESVTLAYYNGYTYAQVAHLLETPLPTVKTRMRDGLIRLRDCLKVAR